MHINEMLPWKILKQFRIPKTGNYLEIDILESQRYKYYYTRYSTTRDLVHNNFIFHPKNAGLDLHFTRFTLFIYSSLLVSLQQGVLTSFAIWSWTTLLTSTERTSCSCKWHTRAKRSARTNTHSTCKFTHKQAMGSIGYYLLQIQSIP